MNYRTLSDLVNETKYFAESIPDDYDLIVGIPRSGMLVANILALHANVAITDVNGVKEGRIMASGRRLDGDLSFDEISSILVVDDSVGSGQTIQGIKTILEPYETKFEIEYGAIYVKHDGHNYVDYWYEKVEKPRVFEWNLMHHNYLSNSCMEIEGTLCRPPTKSERLVINNYQEYVKAVEPNVIPTYRIGNIVTERPEALRERTVDWLNAQGIEYDRLFMYDDDKYDSVTEFKIDMYTKLEASLFIEYDLMMAESLVEGCQKPALCYSENTLITPDTLTKTHLKVREYLGQMIDDPIWFAKRTPKYIGNRMWHGINRLWKK